MNQIAKTMRDGSASLPQILLVEDESSVAKGLQMALTEEGYGVDVAMTGQSALDTLTSKGFDLLVADLRLPDIDGMEIIRQVKDERPETEVIVITGYANVSSAVEAMKTGAVEYLSKPFTEGEFKSAVKEALKGKIGIHGKGVIKDGRSDEERAIQKREVVNILKRDSTSLTELSGYSLPFNFGENLIENSFDGVLACDKNGKLKIFNKSMEKILGYTQDEVCEEMSVSDFFPAGETEKFMEKLYSEECGGKNRLFVFEMDLVDRSGSKVPVQCSAAVMFEADKEVGISASFRDLREIRKLEQEFADQEMLLQQHKMISLGRLAASAVHEINNPLTGILNYLRLMIKILGRGTSITLENLEKFRRYLGLVEGEVSRCSEIVSNLLAFSRKSKLEFGEVDVPEVLEKSVVLSQHKLVLQNIQVRTEIDKEIPSVWGDFNQLQQCVINLIFNAIDAMPDGGILGAGCAYDPNERVVEIRVQDTGCGIPEEDLPHIFDPFYTTKKEGKGLGLGLSTVRGIIEQHKGTVCVGSQLGEGTVFTIKLPVGIKGD